MAPSRALIRGVIAASQRSSATQHLSTPYARSPAMKLLPTRPGSSYLFQSMSIGQSLSRRAFSYSQSMSDAVEPPDYLSEGELHIFNKIKTELEPVKLEVQDVSGGCGSMYALEIESPKFSGLSVIKQHKLVNKVLAEEIKGWHGVQLRTKAA